MKRALFAGLVVALLAGRTAGQEGGDVAARVATLDARLLAALADLAAAYDGRKDPEAAHFLAECALGFGSVDEKLKALKKKWEDEVYYGRSRGGVVLAEAKAIEEKLAPLSKEYKALFDELVKAATGKALTPGVKQLLHGVAVKYELARSAGDYVQATQRFNEVRAKMKLRAILWDFDASSKLILGGWYMAETAHWVSDTKTPPKKEHPAHGDHVEWAQQKSNRLPYWPYNKLRFELASLVENVRASALVRQDLLNPDVRRLWLGRWSAGKELKEIHLYAIPRDEYRRDIATPSSRTRATVAEDRDQWVEVEETMSLSSGGKVLLSKCPSENETDVAAVFCHGESAEYGWNDPTVEQKGASCYGMPVMLRFFGGKELTEVDYELKKKGGLVLSCRKYLTGDKRVDLENQPTVLLLPEKPLDRATSYAVKIKGKLDGTPFEKKWEFTTRDK